jgi:hypothetical protein
MLEKTRQCGLGLMVPTYCLIYVNKMFYLLKSASLEFIYRGQPEGLGIFFIILVIFLN